MTNPAKSPDRHTFQADGYIKRCEEEGKEPNENYLDMYRSARQQDEENIVNPAWQENNLEYDLRSTEWMVHKVQASRVYAQNLYAAICNNEFQKNQVWPTLKDIRWSASWRSAGGIVANMCETGDYIDWYCSGIRDTKPIEPSEWSMLSIEQQTRRKESEAFVSESQVTDEVREDLFRLGWIVLSADNE